MFYGVSYYPEHKNEQELAHDLDLLKKSGINTVRMGEFAWCRMEPQEDVFDFAWLEGVVNKLGKAGVSSVLCTPTACPPVWMVKKHPDILYVDNRGVTRPFGGRRHYCYNNETYREYSRRIAEKIGERFGKNPYVIGFQIDNEPAQEYTGRCHCPVCTKKFQVWMKSKYHTIKEFNRRSGSIFWSQEYHDFDEVFPPVNALENGAEQKVPRFNEGPSIRLDFERFSSETQIEYQNIQAEKLRKYTDRVVTTNTTGLATNSINYYESSKELDCFAFDYYPSLRTGKIGTFPYAFARGMKEGMRFWVLEFTSGGGHKLGGEGRPQSAPGAIKQAAVHSMVCGADMLLHFQFRTFPGGAEQLNYAIVDMDGVPRRRYYEMQETAEILKKLNFLEKSEIRNEVALCFDYDCHWALKIKPVNSPDFEYIRYINELYDILAGMGVGADVVSFQADFKKYKTVILPAAIIMSKETQEKLKKFVAEGGVLVSTFLTSVKNPDNMGYTVSLPAGLNDLFGVTVQEAEPVFKEFSAKVRLNVKAGTDTILECNDSLWSELLNGTGQKVGEYLDSYKKGEMVVSRNEYRIGTAFYIGTGLSRTVMEKILGDACDRAGVKRNLILPTFGLEIIRRQLEGNDLYCVFNFNEEEAVIEFPGDMKNLESGRLYRGKAAIAGRGMLFLESRT